MKRTITLLMCILIWAGMTSCFTACAAQPDSALPEGRYLIDLHLHADGALSPDTVLRLAGMQGVSLPTQDRDELFSYLSVPVDCKDLNEYLECFDLPVSVMQTKETLSEAFFSIKEELKADGLAYAELRFAPQLHTSQGLTQEDVVRAALEGCSRSDLKTNLILCCMRGNDNHEANMETVRVAHLFRNQGVAAVDLAGAEALFPTESFEDVFAYAKQLGLNCTIHAGEADGPQSVAKALDFGASRIGHGVHSAQDEALMARLRDAGAALEICITSNLQTKAEQSIETYPLKKLIDYGVTVTLNTDNPTVSNTTMRKELELAKRGFDLTNDEIKQLLLNAARCSFADEETKAALVEAIEQAF